jgi:transposase
MSVNDTSGTTRANSAGVDWAKEDYAGCVLDADGEPLQRVTLRSTKTGLRRLSEVLDHHQVNEVGIERGDGPIVEALLATGRAVYVIPPPQVKALRGRYGSAGNKDDRFDAYVLADTVRTDRRRLTPLLLDGEATTALRKLCGARKDLVAHRMAVANQLRAHLAIALPAGRTNPAVLYERSNAAPRGATGDYGQALAGITRAYLATLTTITAQIDTLTQHITEALATHPDRDISTSLPQAGSVRAARLLAEIGDARGRFPTPDSLACLAGVAPSTRQSAKVTIVAFRWAVDEQLRDALCDFAGGSRHANPWAADL